MNQSSNSRRIAQDRMATAHLICVLQEPFCRFPAAPLSGHSTASDRHVRILRLRYRHYLFHFALLLLRESYCICTLLLFLRLFSSFVILQVQICRPTPTDCDSKCLCRNPQRHQALRLFDCCYLIFHIFSFYAATLDGVMFSSTSLRTSASQITRAIVTSTALPINFFWSACVPIST